MSAPMDYPASPLRPGLRAALFAATGTAGKDVVRFIALPLGMALIYMVSEMIAPSLADKSPILSRFRGAELYFRMLAVTAYAIGLVLTFEERETRTWWFLRLLPARPLGLLAHKLLAGVVLLGVYMAAVSAVVAVIPGGWGELTHWLSEPDRVQACVAQTLAGFATGFALPLVLPPNLVTIVLAGLAALVAFMALAYTAGGVATGGFFSAESSYYVGSRGYAVMMVAWSVIMALIAIAAVGRREGEIARSMPAVEVALSTRRRRWWHRDCGFDPPTVHLLRLPLILTITAAVILPWLMRVWNRDDSESHALLLFLMAPLLGASAVSHGERLRHTFYLYSLPVSRGHFFRKRMGALLAASVVLVMAWLTPILLSLLKMPAELLGVFVAGAVVCMSTAVTAWLCALLLRVRLFAIMAALMVSIPFGIAAGASLTSMLFGRPVFGWSEPIVYLAWALLVAVGLPVLASWLAFCRSPLLEQSEGRRALVALIVLPLLAAWGTLLLLVSPQHFFIMIFG